MVGFFEKIHAKLEIYRLEKRYTRNRDRRTTFFSNAVYVDGEYVYNTPTSTGSSTQSATSSPVSDLGRHSLEEPRSPAYVTETQTTPKKKLHRFSSMPGFGSVSKNSTQDWRTGDVNVGEMR